MGAPASGLFYGGGFGQLGIQFLGVIACFGFAAIAMYVVFKVIDSILGLRVSHETELRGLDLDELGLGAEPTVVPRGPTGEPVIVLSPDLVPSSISFDPASEVTTFAFTPDGAHVAAMGVIEGRFAVETQAVEGGLRRITSVEAADALVGHTRDGRLLILRASDGDIVFHDWSRGATFRIPFDLGTVLTADA